MPFPQIQSIDELLRLGQPGLACDLDETSCYTVFRWMEILLEEFGNPENLTAQQMVEKYQYVQNVSYFYTPEIDARIKELTVSNQLQKELPSISGADEYIQKVNSIVPIRCYLTTRPDCVVEGTRDWLIQHEFPEAGIFAKPQEVLWSEGSRWKAGILRQAYPKLLGIIDDNQGLIDKLGPDYPGTIFLFGHQSSPNNHRFVVPCQDWREVYLEVLRYYS